MIDFSAIDHPIFGNRPPYTVLLQNSLEQILRIKSTATSEPIILFPQNLFKNKFSIHMTESSFKKAFSTKWRQFTEKTVVFPVSRFIAYIQENNTLDKA